MLLPSGMQPPASGPLPALLRLTAQPEDAPLPHLLSFFGTSWLSSVRFVPAAGVECWACSHFLHLCSVLAAVLWVRSELSHLFVSASKRTIGACKNPLGCDGVLQASKQYGSTAVTCGGFPDPHPTTPTHARTRGHPTHTELARSSCALALPGSCSWSCSDGIVRQEQVAPAPALPHSALPLRLAAHASLFRQENAPTSFAASASSRRTPPCPVC